MNVPIIKYILDFYTAGIILILKQQMNEVKLFLESIKSEDTKKQYTYCLKKFFDFVGGEGELPNDRKEIENKIIEYRIQKRGSADF